MGTAELITAPPTFYRPAEFSSNSGIPNWEDAKHYADADAWNVASGDAMNAFEAGSNEGMRRLRDISNHLGQFSGADASERAVSYAKFVQNYMNGTGASFGEAMQVKEQVEKDMKEGKKPGGKSGGKGKGEGEEITPEEVKLSRTEFFKYLFKKRLKLDQLLDETELVKDPRGRIKRTRKMYNLGEIQRVKPTEFGSPVLTQNLISKDIRVVERFKRTSHKKVSFVLLDDSGSMSNPKKQGVLRAVAELLADNCEELYFSTYVQEAENHQRIHNREELEKYLKDTYSAAHGWTAIGDVLLLLSQQLKQNKFGPLDVNPGPKPQIVIILDGEDTVYPVPGLCAVHAVSIGQNNEALQRLCLTSGGSYQYVP